MKERQLTPREAAACLVAILLQRRGAVLIIKPDGYLLCDLDGADISGHAEADDLARCVLSLREEIKQLLA